MQIAKRTLAKVGGGLLVAILLIWFITRLFAWCSCSWYGYQTNRDTRYAAFVGCMVKVGEQWVPRDELRVVQ